MVELAPHGIVGKEVAASDESAPLKLSVNCIDEAANAETSFAIVYLIALVPPGNTGLVIKDLLKDKPVTITLSLAELLLTASPSDEADISLLVIV